MELYPNIFTGGIWMIVAIICIVSLFLILSKKINLPKKLILIGLLSIPLLDMTFGITRKIRDQIKGEIVLSAFDDAPIFTKSITIRQKNGKFIGEYDFSSVGFSQTEKSDVQIENNKTVILSLNNNELKKVLLYYKERNVLQDAVNGTS